MTDADKCGRYVLVSGQVGRCAGVLRNLDGINIRDLPVCKHDLGQERSHISAVECYFRRFYYSGVRREESFQLATA